MGIHESSVNYRNLIRDLADMYPQQDVPEVVVIENIANSLDAGATRIEITYNPGERVLVVRDNGTGMDTMQFEQYHDFAAGLKTRGDGIGFAGVGAKISFNIAEKVITHTRAKGFSGGSEWHFAERGKLVWEDVKPKSLSSHGTNVEVRFRDDAKIPYSSCVDLEELIKRWYLPLLDPTFLRLYEQLNYYSRKMRFVVNGKVMEPCDVASTFELEKTKNFVPQSRSKRIGYGILGIAQKEYPIATDVSGVLLCTRGKVIKSELFSQFPGDLGPRIFGLVEVPDLVKYLTTSKTDFIRRVRNKELERLLDPVRQEFKDWLAQVGIQQVGESGSDEAVKLERELKRIVGDVPELEEFFGFRMRKHVLIERQSGSVTAIKQDGSQVTFPTERGKEKGNGEGPLDVGDDDGTALIEDKKASETRAEPISRTARRGPKITLADVPKRMELGWVEGNTVIINTGHPCYVKSKSNYNSRRIHSIYTIATVVQRFLAGDDKNTKLMFIDKMMGAWGKK